MKPTEILDQQNDLLKRLYEEDHFGRYVKGVMGLAEEAGRFEGMKDLPEPGQTDYVYERLRHSVEYAYAYRVTKEMSYVVQYAGDSLDENDRLDGTLAPTPWGIVRFDRPIPLRDARNRQMLMHWMTWGPVHGQRQTSFGALIDATGMVFSYWNDTNEPDEIQRWIEDGMKPDARRSMIERTGRWSFIGTELVWNGMKVGKPQKELTTRIKMKILANGDTPTSYTNCARYAHALFLMLNQTLTTMDDEYIPRAHRKRIARMKIPGRISVIALRRMEGSKREGETHVEWSHRWIVRGFWAWRHCGETHPQAQEYEKGWRVRVWIAPYVKGPEGLPIVQTEKLYDLRR